MFEGTHPAVDPFDNPWPANSRQEALAGKDICNGEYFGVVWVFANDKEHACNEFRETHFNADACCGLCKADRGELNVRNVQLDARWRHTIALPRVLNGPEFAHKVWTTTGVNRFMDSGDWQHTVDSGALLQLHGGCIRELTANNGPLMAATSIGGSAHFGNICNQSTQLEVDAVCRHCANYRLANLASHFLN